MAKRWVICLYLVMIGLLSYYKCLCCPLATNPHFVKMATSSERTPPPFPETEDMDVDTEIEDLESNESEYTLVSVSNIAVDVLTFSNVSCETMLTDRLAHLRYRK